MPSTGPPLAPGAVVVRPTGDRGNGAFAAAAIPVGTYLGDYTGELLDRSAFFARYPSGVVSLVERWGQRGCGWRGLQACSGSAGALSMLLPLQTPGGPAPHLPPFCMQTAGRLCDGGG